MPGPPNPPPPPPPPPPRRARGPAAVILEEAAAAAAAAADRPSPPRRPPPAPVIAELLRTRRCVPGSVFLVEGVDAHVPAPSAPANKHHHHRTVRLLLGDGDWCVQALLGPEAHRLVDHGRVAVGARVRLRQFELRAVPCRASSTSSSTNDDDHRDHAPPPIIGGTTTTTTEEEEMIFLVVWDMVTVGWDTAYMRMAGVLPVAEEEEEQQQQQQQPLPPLQLDKPEEEEAAAETGRRVGGNSSSDNQQQQGTTTTTTSKDNHHAVPVPPRLLRAATTQPLAPDAVLPPSETNKADTTKNPQRQQQTPATTTTTTSSSSSSSSNPLLPWAAAADDRDLARPLRLTPLRSVPNLPYKQNWVVNVLAVVAALSGVEAAVLAPYRQQRTARLADPSTRKQVLLTVFRDPAGFAPAVGSVVLLLGVKNHRFDGGCLKKYGNEPPGARWWWENPREIAWCDVDGLSSWWAAQPREGGSSAS